MFINCQICGNTKTDEINFKTCCCKKCEHVYDRFIRIKNELREKDIELDRIRDKVLFILSDFKQELLNNEEIKIKSEKLLDLYDAAEMKAGYGKESKLFLAKEVVEGFVVCQAFRVFRKRDSTERDTLEEKLEDLYESCLKVCEFNNWEDTFDLKPQNLKFSGKNTNLKNGFRKSFIRRIFGFFSKNR